MLCDDAYTTNRASGPWRIVVWMTQIKTGLRLNSQAYDDPIREKRNPTEIAANRLTRPPTQGPRTNPNDRQSAKAGTITATRRKHNGRFLRHRPERSERCMNYEGLYQGQPALTKLEGVPQA